MISNKRIMIESIGKVKDVKVEKVFISYFDINISEEKKWKIKDYFFTAIKFNDLKTLKVLSYIINDRMRIRIFIYLARYGDANTFIFFSKIYNPNKVKLKNLFSNCIKYGNLKLLKYLVNIGCRVKYSFSLSRCKDMDCFKYCIQFYEGDISIILHKTRNINIVKYLIDNFKDKIRRLRYMKGELIIIKIMHPELYNLLKIEMII